MMGIFQAVKGKGWCRRMRMSQDEKDKSRARIIASASRLVRERGVDGASVGDVMGDAGLTHGGFYKHFESKDALLATALDSAFDEIVAMLAPQLEGETAAAHSIGFQAFYLSDGHVASPSMGCPVAALSGDFARGAAALKERFGGGVRRIIGLLARGNGGSESARRVRATRQLAMMAGAVMIARASDPDTARAVLSACRDQKS